MGERPELTVEQAAVRLGISKWATYKAVNRGELALLPGSGPARLAPGAVEGFRAHRQEAALQRLAAKGVDLVQLARDVRMFLRPPVGAPSSGGVQAVGDDVRAVFGMPALTAAAIKDETVCRWCATNIAAEMLRTDPPTYAAPYLELLGPPCGRHGELLNAEMAKLGTRINGPVVRPSAARAARPAVPRPATPAAVARTPVQRPAQPAARPASAGTLRSALAAAGAAARPGRLRCGHLLAEQCSCPRLASKAVTASARPKPKPAADPTGQRHSGACGCGCQCTHGTQR